MHVISVLHMETKFAQHNNTFTFFRLNVLLTLIIGEVGSLPWGKGSEKTRLWTWGAFEWRGNESWFRLFD